MPTQHLCFIISHHRRFRLPGAEIKTMNYCKYVRFVKPYEHKSINLGTVLQKKYLRLMEKVMSLLCGSSGLGSGAFEWLAPRDGRYWRSWTQGRDLDHVDRGFPESRGGNADTGEQAFGSWRGGVQGANRPHIQLLTDGVTFHFFGPVTFENQSGTIPPRLDHP